VVTNPLLVPSGLGNPLLSRDNWLAPPPRLITGEMILRIWDVEHGACAMLHHLQNGIAGRLAMIDSGDTAEWSPSAFIRYELNRTTLDYLFITNADQDHISDLQGLWDRGINVPVWFRNPTLGPEIFRKIKEQSGADERDISRRGGQMRKGRVEPNPRNHDADAFGPMTRMSLGFAASSIACCSEWPCSPSSAKPAVMITAAARVPRSPSSPINEGTVSAGVAMTARSGARGRLVIFG